MLVSTTVKFRAGSPKLKFLVLAIETTRTLLLKFPDREPDSGYRELAHISQMSQHMVQKSGLYYAEGAEIILNNQVTEWQLRFIGDADDNFGRRGPSCHLAYSVPSGAGAIEWFYNEVTVPVHNDIIGSYFMATGFDGGYFGIQVNSSTERRVLFSIWSAYKTDDPSAIPADYKVTSLKAGDNVTVQDFGNKGTGKQSFLRFD